MSSTFIITKDGLFVCGKNNKYQLGLGHNDQVLNLTKVNVENVVEVKHCEYGVTLFTTSDGSVYASGKVRRDIGYPRLFDGSIMTKLDIPPILSIDDYRSPIIFRTVEGIYIWSYEPIFLGVRAKMPAKLDINIPIIISIHIGYQSVLFNTVDGLYYCDNRGKSRPTKINIPKVIEVYYYHYDHAVVKTIAGIYVWGYGIDGQLGLGHGNKVADPVLLDIPEVLFANCRQHESIFVTVDGVYVCGRNLSNKLLPEGESILLPTLVELPKVVKIYSKWRYVVYDTVDGLFAFGKISGKIDLPEIINIIPKPLFIVFHTISGVYIRGKLNNKKINLLFDQHPVYDIIIGSRYIILATPAGYYSVGNNKYGQLGFGHKNDVDEFTKIPNFEYNPIQERRFARTKKAKPCSSS